MEDKLVYIVNSDYRLFSSFEDILLIEKNNFLYPNEVTQNNILIAKINQWNYEELEKLHKYFIDKNILKVNIEYDQWTNDLMNFFRLKQLKFDVDLNEDFASLYDQLKINVLDVITLIESKPHIFANNFFVYLISILPIEIGNELIKIYFYEKNSFKTTLIWLTNKLK